MYMFYVIICIYDISPKSKENRNMLAVLFFFFFFFIAKWLMLFLTVISKRAGELEHGLLAAHSQEYTKIFEGVVRT